MGWYEDEAIEYNRTGRTSMRAGAVRYHNTIKGKENEILPSTDDKYRSALWGIDIDLSTDPNPNSGDFYHEHLAPEGWEDHWLERHKNPYTKYEKEILQKLERLSQKGKGDMTLYGLKEGNFLINKTEENMQFLIKVREMLLRFPERLKYGAVCKNCGSPYYSYLGPSYFTMNLDAFVCNNCNYFWECPEENSIYFKLVKNDYINIDDSLVWNEHHLERQKHYL